MQQPAANDRPVKTLTESQAAESMWIYYRDHKSILSSDIREFRDVILSELMLGVSAERVFARFVVVPAVQAPVRRTQRAK